MIAMVCCRKYRRRQTGYVLIQPYDAQPIYTPQAYNVNEVRNLSIMNAQEK